MKTENSDFGQDGGVQLDIIAPFVGIARILYPIRCEASRDSATYFWPDPKKKPVFAGYEESDCHFRARILEKVSR